MTKRNVIALSSTLANRIIFEFMIKLEATTVFMPCYQFTLGNLSRQNYFAECHLLRNSFHEVSSYMCVSFKKVAGQVLSNNLWRKAKGQTCERGGSPQNVRSNIFRLWKH